MNQITELAIKNIHPKWKHLLGSPVRSGELLIDVLDRTVQSVVNLNVKLCPDNPDKILRCLQLDPDLIKTIILGQDPFPTPGIATGLCFACSGKFQPSLNIIVRELGIEYQDESIIERFN